jgi:Family of unknown function (DUF5829)
MKQPRLNNKSVEYLRQRLRFKRLHIMTLMPRLLVIALCAGAILTPLFAQALQPVYFNHITIFVSTETYDALLQSPFLRDEFSAFQEHTVHRDGGAWSYTGIFLSGQHTYLELFKAGQDPHFGTTIPGQVVFNMWIDDRSQLSRFKDRLAAETGATLLIDIARNAQNQPMYDTVVSKGSPASDFGPGMRVDTHIKGYYPDGITREKRLERGYLPARYLHDVTGFTLTTNETERNRLIQEFRAYSYDIGAGGEKQIVSGPGITFALVLTKPGAPRTLVIDFSMNDRKTTEQTYKFTDAAQLRIQGSTAQWVFTFPSNE